MTIPFYRIPFDNTCGDIPPPEVVGNKAHNLMRIAEKGPVPPGFVIPVDFCRQFSAMTPEELEQLEQQVQAELEWLERATGKQFNGKRNPLLVSVRSGAPVSMPGMMETVLNIGLNEETARGMIRQTGNPKFVRDCSRRFVQQFGEVVHGLSPLPFERMYERLTKLNSPVNTIDPDIETLRKITAEYIEHFTTQVKSPFPLDPFDQLLTAIKAVIRSWQGKRAVTYRKIHDIGDEIGTAVIIQAMVFGNSGRCSGSGVGFTRNPANGDKQPFIDYLPNAQGEDVVSGRRNVAASTAIARDLPDIHNQLKQVCCWLEEEFHDMQDFEFTVEQGKLFLLQSRSGKRTAPAALKIAVDLVEEGVISSARGLDLLSGYDPQDFSTTNFIQAEGESAVASAVSASSGVASGIAAFDLERAKQISSSGKPVIYLCKTLSTNDVEIINRVNGIVTILGARTSHAAVVARQLGKICLVACQELQIGDDLRHCYFGGKRVEEGEHLSLDGESGTIYLGQLQQVSARPDEILDKLASWKQSSSL